MPFSISLSTAHLFPNSSPPLFEAENTSTTRPSNLKKAIKRAHLFPNSSPPLFEAENTSTTRPSNLKKAIKRAPFHPVKGKIRRDANSLNIKRIYLPEGTKASYVPSLKNTLISLISRTGLSIIFVFLDLRE